MSVDLTSLRGSPLTADTAEIPQIHIDSKKHLKKVKDIASKCLDSCGRNCHKSPPDSSKKFSGEINGAVVNLGEITFFPSKKPLETYQPSQSSKAEKKSSDDPKQSAVSKKND
ncbi:MAG: hypothetical protein AAGI90_02865 [Chlamydiota bacterium]